MKAVILAAGRGERLGQAGRDQPKALLAFDGVTLLERHIQNLAHGGIRQVYLITGYQQQAIEQAIAGLTIDITIQTIYNANYTQGSMVSLYCARDILAAATDLILMDADVLYHTEILQRLIHSQHRNCLLLDEHFAAGDEPVKICIHADRIVELRKQIDGHLRWDIQGESVGFFRFDGRLAAQLLQQVQRRIDEGHVNEPHEEAIRALVLGQPEQFHYENITGLPWIEIDFPEDVQRAQTEVLERFHA